MEAVRPVSSANRSNRSRTQQPNASKARAQSSSQNKPITSPKPPPPVAQQSANAISHSSLSETGFVPMKESTILSIPNLYPSVYSNTSTEASSSNVMNAYTPIQAGTQVFSPQIVVPPKMSVPAPTEALYPVVEQSEPISNSITLNQPIIIDELEPEPLIEEAPSRIVPAPENVAPILVDNPYENSNVKTDEKPIVKPPTQVIFKPVDYGKSIRRRSEDQNTNTNNIISFDEMLLHANMPRIITESIPLTHSQRVSQYVKNPDQFFINKKGNSVQELPKPRPSPVRSINQNFKRSSSNSLISSSQNSKQSDISNSQSIPTLPTYASVQTVLINPIIMENEETEDNEKINESIPEVNLYQKLTMENISAPIVKTSGFLPPISSFNEKLKIKIKKMEKKNDDDDFDLNKILILSRVNKPLSIINATTQPPRDNRSFFKRLFNIGANHEQTQATNNAIETLQVSSSGEVLNAPIIRAQVPQLPANQSPDDELFDDDPITTKKRFNKISPLVEISLRSNIPKENPQQPKPTIEVIFDPVNMKVKTLPIVQRVIIPPTPMYTPPLPSKPLDTPPVSSRPISNQQTPPKTPAITPIINPNNSISQNLIPAQVIPPSPYLTSLEEELNEQIDNNSEDEAEVIELPRASSHSNHVEFSSLFEEVEDTNETKHKKKKELNTLVGSFSDLEPVSIAHQTNTLNAPAIDNSVHPEQLQLFQEVEGNEANNSQDNISIIEEASQNNIESTPLTGNSEEGESKPKPQKLSFTLPPLPNNTVSEEIQISTNESQTLETEALTA